MKKHQIEYYTQFIMSLVGGFFGAYAILNHHDFFGSAQTSNMIYLVLNIIGRDFYGLLLRLLAFAIYIIGIVSTILLPRYIKVDIQVCSVILNILAVIGLVFMPEDTNDVVALYPVFFVTAFQWCSFKGVEGFASSSVFSTNNLRQFVTSVTGYCLEKNEADLKKLKFFGGVLLFYHMGVILSSLSYLLWKAKGIIVCLLPLMFAVVIIYRKNYKKDIISSSN